MRNSEPLRNYGRREARALNRCSSDGHFYQHQPPTDKAVDGPVFQRLQGDLGLDSSR